MSPFILSKTLKGMWPLFLLLFWVIWEVQKPMDPLLLIPASPALECHTPPTFRIAYQQDRGGVFPQLEGFQFSGLGWIQADVCRRSLLVIKAEGQTADGQAPILRVLLDSQLLAEENISQQKIIRVNIPKPGRVTVAYVNDYYASEARIAFLEQFNFLGEQCRQLAIEVPQSTGGQWSPQANAASLIFNVPMSLTPCSAGELTFRAFGRSINNFYPLLKIEQKGLISKEIHLSEEPQTVRLNTSSSKITIKLMNPYFKEIGDRNLSIKTLYFLP